MLKSLFPDIDWPRVRVVGFDMDGTLYDEAEFIWQCYLPISEYLAQTIPGGSARGIRVRMYRRWLEKGSSYNRIFSEVLADAGFPEEKQDELSLNCVEIFRRFKPGLNLPSRVRALLDEFRQQYPIFLVSDGSAELQSAKFRSLGLSEWFADGNVAISGVFGRGFQKPAVAILEKVEVVKSMDDNSAVVYFGDRDVDRMFCEAAGFQHVRVSCMVPVGI